MRHFSSGFRFSALVLCVCAAFTAVGVRLVYLHVWMHQKAVSEVAAVRRQVEVLKARRGDIVDRNGTPLATSRTVIQVGVDPEVLAVDRKAPRAAGSKIPPFEERWASLAGLLNMSPAEMLARIESRAGSLDSLAEAVRNNFAAGTPARASFIPGGSPSDDEGPAEGVPQESGQRRVRYVKLADAVEDSTFASIRALGIKGVVGTRSYRRFYPGDSLASHIVGFVNRENVATMGIEHRLDFYLRGQDGWRESEQDGRRREVARFRSREVPAVDGMTVELSLDMVVQHMLERELAQIQENFRPQSATIIVSEARTGFLLGMANTPTFNLNEFNTAPLENQKNRGITDQLEPGSTFKIVPIAGALNERLVTPETTFDCTLTSIDIGGRSVRLPREAHAFQGRLSVAQIVAKSSNIGSAQMGIALGADRLYRYARAFGFGEESGFPLPGEIRGQLAPPKLWDGLTITRLPMGHAIAATPLQIHMAMSTIANDGVLQRPQIIRRVLASDGQVFTEMQPVDRSRAVSVQTARLMRTLLAKVVSKEGTANAAAIPGYEIAGKTGTTQKIINNRYSSAHHIATFSGFFPASNPRVVVTVVVDEADVPGTAYASRVAVPSFKRISEQLIQYLGIAPVSDANHFAANVQ